MFALPALFFLKKGWIAKQMKKRLVIYAALLGFQVSMLASSDVRAMTALHNNSKMSYHALCSVGVDIWNWDRVVAVLGN